MLEGLLVVTMLVVALGGAGFLHHLFAAKMRANREARLAAWSRALEGCTAEGGGDELWNSQENDGLDEISEDSPPGFLKVGHTSSSTTADDVRAPNGTTGPSMTSSQQVACNDHIEGESDSIFSKIGDALGVIKQAF
jgi:hypothetical protein